MDDRMTRHLVEQAIYARERAYAPYSGFRVGAALLAKSQKIYLGCNVENSSYGATACAERNAFAAAVCDSQREFEAIAICSSGEDYCYPCGICRQIMAEFCEDLIIITVNGKREFRKYTLSELFPHAFCCSDIREEI
jgi:cytidine deaminase